MEKSEKLTSEMAKAMDRVRAEADAWLATAAGTDDRIKALAEDLARSDAEVGRSRREHARGEKASRRHCRRGHEEVVELEPALSSSSPTTISRWRSRH